MSDLTERSIYNIPKVSNNEDIEIGSVWDVSITKTGNMATFRSNVSGKILTNNKFIEIGTIPIEYRPLQPILVNYITQNGDIMLLEITADGKISIYLNGTTSNEGFILRQTITYPVA